MQIGFVGLGTMGGMVARDLLDSSHEVTLFDVSPVALAPFVELGATIAKSLHELAEASNVIGICVVDDDQVRDVIMGPDGLLQAGLRPDTVVMVHSTVHPNTVRELATEVEAVGSHLIDACLSAGPMSKTRIDRIVIVGGDPEIYRRCTDVLTVIGTPNHVGELGAGATVKLLNNLLVVALIGASDDLLRAGEQIGIDRRLLEQILLSGSSTNNPLSIMVRRRDRSAHRLQMLDKDARLAVEHLHANGVELAGLDELARHGLRAVEADIAPENRS
jgi:3-hydroxyisobutyrate dehydrogenase